jgi:hypothetical protein
MAQRTLAVIITFADCERGLRIARLSRHRKQPQRSLRRRLGQALGARLRRLWRARGETINLPGERIQEPILLYRHGQISLPSTIMQDWAIRSNGAHSRFR